MKIVIPTTGGDLPGEIYWPPSPEGVKHILVINSSLEADPTLYQPFCTFMASQGLVVLMYEYTNSYKPLTSWTTAIRSLGANDFEGVLQWIFKSFSDYQISVVGHGVGGVIIGFAPSIHRIHSIINVNAQAVNRSWRTTLLP